MSATSSRSSILKDLRQRSANKEHGKLMSIALQKKRKLEVFGGQFDSNAENSIFISQISSNCHKFPRTVTKFLDLSQNYSNCHKFPPKFNNLLQNVKMWVEESFHQHISKKILKNITNTVNFGRFCCGIGARIPDSTRSFVLFNSYECT